MAKNTPTPILINTDILSRLIGDVLDIAGVPASKKSACLNKAADRIAGPKHNWGALTNQDGPIVARGLSGYDVVKTAAPVQNAAPADTAPTNPASIAPDLFPKVVHDALSANMKLLLLSGQPGTGISTLVDDLARAMDRETYHIRTSLLLEDEMVCRDDETRLPEGLRPREDASEITIFEDVDGLSDAGLKALLKEIYIPSRTSPAAQIVLITNFRDRFVSRLREVAPELLNKAVSLHMESPIHPAITEFMQNKPSLGDLDFSDTVLPSMESLDKVNQILRKTNETGIGAVREANNIVCAPGGAREYKTAPPHVEAAGLHDLITYMEDCKELSPRVVAYMRRKFDAVEEGLRTLKVMPQAWQDVARLTQLFDDSCRFGTQARQNNHAEQIRRYAYAQLGQHATGLLRHLEL